MNAELTTPNFPRTLTASKEMHPLETYLEELRAIRSSGAAVKETSGYGVLATLLNAVGHMLKPKVRCFIHVKNSGAGLPDGGLFTADQLKTQMRKRRCWAFRSRRAALSRSRPPIPK